MNIRMYPFYIRCEEGIDEKTKIVKMSEPKLAYNLTITENYIECESEDEVKIRLIQDLKILRKQLETELNERYSMRNNKLERKI